MHCNLQSSDNLRPTHRRAWSRAFATVLVAAALAACSPGGGSNPAPTNTPIGQAVQLGGEEFTILSVSAHSYVGPPSKPLRAKEGGVLIVVRYELHNLGSKPLATASARQISLIDPQGGMVASDPALTAAYLSTSALKDGAPELAPGAREKQARVFDPPAANYPRGWAIVIGDKTHRVELQ